MFDPLPPLRSSTPAVDAEGFLRVVQDALNLHVQTTQVPANFTPTLLEDYPRQRQGNGFDNSFSVILFTVNNALMGATDAARTRRPTGIALREDKQSDTRARYRTRVYGWWEDTTVEFRVLAKSNHDANTLAIWFHRFMMRYGCTMQYFRAHGVQKFQFEARLGDRISNEFGQELYERRLQYLVRLEYLDSFEVKGLDEIEVTVSAKTETSDSEVLDFTVGN